MLDPLLYLRYSGDVPTTADNTTPVVADNTAFITVHEILATVTHRVKTHLKTVVLVEKWRMKANETKSVLVTFTLKRSRVPTFT